MAGGSGLQKRASLSSESANFSIDAKSATVSFGDDASTKALAGSICNRSGYHLTHSLFLFFYSWAHCVKAIPFKKQEEQFWNALMGPLVKEGQLLIWWLF